MAKFKLGIWLNNRLEALGKQSADRPPFLPSPRPRPLTPAAANDSFSQPSTCLIFSKLPADIRRTIFITAFGDRTVHIDLVFDYPLLPPPPRPTGGEEFPNHAGIYLQNDNDKSPPPVGRKVWRWGGTICHRNEPRLPRDHPAFRWSRKSCWDDNCMRGEAWMCRKWEGQWPDKCRIGVMGFLLSCKQAYVEVIDILYGANCISISSDPLMLRLPQLLPPQRLANISSMELLVKGYKTQQEFREGYMDLGSLGPILHHLTIHCQSLRSLCLSLNISDLANINELINGPALPTIDAFYLSMELREMTVEIPELVFKCWKRHITVVPHHPLEPTEPIFPGLKPWRCFDEENGEGRLKPKMQLRKLANYPKPPLQLPTRENADRCDLSEGYWIKDGRPDPTLPSRVCRGF